MHKHDDQSAFDKLCYDYSLADSGTSRYTNVAEYLLLSAII